MGEFRLGTTYEAPPETRARPLEPQGIKDDGRLFGVWCSGDKRYLHIRPSATGDGLYVLAVETGYEVRWLSLQAYRTGTPDGAIHYIAKRIQGRGLDYSGHQVEPGYVTVRVVFSNTRTMVLSFMSPEFAKAHGKKLQANVSLFTDVAYYFLDLDRETLVSRIESQGWASVFTMRAGPFRKLGPGLTACPSEAKK
jgi:hypothetical protein